MGAKHTWIDVTELVAWKGFPTGIPRVTYNLVTRYADHADVSLVAFHRRSRQFREVDAQTILEFTRRQFRERSQPKGRRSNQVPSLAVPLESASERLRSQPPLYFARISTRAMHFVLGRPALRRLAWSVLRRLPRTEARLRAAYARDASWVTERQGQFTYGLTDPSPLRRYLYSMHAAAHPARFSPGDRLIVLGAGWLSDSFQEALAELRRGVGLLVYQVLYDLAPIVLPHSFGPGFAESFTRYLFEAAALSDGLIAISASSRSEALAFCESVLLPPPTIEVFRLGDEGAPANEPSTPVSELENTTFVLSVGTFELRKNYHLLYQVWRLGAERPSEELPQLVIVGKRGWAAGDTMLAMAGDPMVNDSITVLHGVSDGELEWLYENCLFTIYPSLYEGWGLPIAESLAHGKLCLASNASAMPEVAGDLIEYFSPYDAGECFNLVVRHLEPSILHAKEREIAQRYVPTSWQESFRQFDAALRRIEGQLAP